MCLNDLLCLGNGIRSKHSQKIVKENSSKLMQNMLSNEMLLTSKCLPSSFENNCIVATADAVQFVIILETDLRRK